ncbi:RING-type domain-containing protein [Chloropicon primus]|uniref:RING-type domain-containing protein n=1 Tax=Chloropicon primus TaxID=1764295 RepID=A0A5B8MJU8_9CHLO|nr:hypothetical protein A3770_03p21500 [Chloropicon primus]UPQ98844.1 RING-type domain-containing protein [Chloropicon primus]|mmetsp:Transcript_4878/g.14597  ORF Transcript_4878/g.14597 Transcript_4878/m.14597 type:complete len:333 (-) Transcript_4878:447-1445(-)|eukprot:QDZ19632.1 hypothetical protein A3770_03p21500 [Chloropicon primus]
MSNIVLTFGGEGGGNKERDSVVSQLPSRKKTQQASVAPGENTVTNENEASSSARRSRAVISARRFHSRNMADIQRQAERGRKKRLEYEAKREKIQNELNHQKEAEERRAQQQRAMGHLGDASSSSRHSRPAVTRPMGTTNLERDLELLDIQREQFYAGLTDSHSQQRQEMEEYELALAISLSMAEANGRPAQIFEPGPASSIMFPTSSAPVTTERASALGRSGFGTGRFRGGQDAGAPQQQWELGEMSYEDLCKLEDVKVTAPKRVIENLETKIVDDSSVTKDDICSICQCGFDAGEKIKKLPCGHTFHAECADEWLGKYSTNCPVCKERVC